MISLTSTTKGSKAPWYFYSLFSCLCIRGLISPFLPQYLVGEKLLHTLTTLILFRVLFSRVVSDYTSPNLLSGSHMHNFAFGCTKRLFSQTCLICQVTQPALQKCFSLIITIPPGFIISAYLISSEFISTCRAMMKMLNRTESKIHPNIISMTFAKHC